MEQGWDRVRAASFAWESTAFPMLTGTLVTSWHAAGKANAAGAGPVANRITGAIAIEIHRCQAARSPRVRFATRLI